MSDRWSGKKALASKLQKAREGKSHDYLHAYEEGHTAHDADSTVKNYKSRRRVRESESNV